MIPIPHDIEVNGVVRFKGEQRNRWRWEGRLSVFIKVRITEWPFSEWRNIEGFMKKRCNSSALTVMRYFCHP